MLLLPTTEALMLRNGALMMGSLGKGNSPFCPCQELIQVLVGRALEGNDSVTVLLERDEGTLVGLVVGRVARQVNVRLDWAARLMICERIPDDPISSAGITPVLENWMAAISNPSGVSAAAGGRDC